MHFRITHYHDRKGRRITKEESSDGMSLVFTGFCLVTTRDTSGAVVNQQELNFPIDVLPNAFDNDLVDAAFHKFDAAAKVAADAWHEDLKKSLRQNRIALATRLPAAVAG